MRTWRASESEYTNKYYIENNGVRIYFDKFVVGVDKWTFYVDGGIIAEIQRDQNSLLDPKNLLSKVIILSEEWKFKHE